MEKRERFATFGEFYPYYLAEHANRTSRRLHFIGTTLVPVWLAAAALTGIGWLVLVAVLQAYAFAWVGHYFFEHNRPATFRHPGYSLMGDWRMWWEILTGKIRF